VYYGRSVHGSDLFQAIGGTHTCRKLSKAFYARVAQDPLLRPFFPGKTFTCAIEEFAAFLVQFLGGPSQDSERRWWLSLYESHRRFKIGQEHRDAWMNQMFAALDDAGIEEPARSALRNFFERASAYIIDREPQDAPLHLELERRWHAQKALDDAVASVRSGDACGAIALAERCDPALLPGLLALMTGSGNTALLEFVREQLVRNPALAQQRYNGRTLLHAAAAAGSLTTVELLLHMGADPNALDGGKHTPLYSLGNEHSRAGGADVVRALVRGGAQVDANGGVKRCTALHMAARRGNVDVAAALLECGAQVDVRDSHGDTPLQRAINCRQPKVAALLRYYCPVSRKT
jgi:truncated hemoglobin YjbI